ncbi:OLC1v1033888C3 [Oldenlandia corymbosa var. corymbosa]|uniref:Fatty acyl-CoA reductase n=1 Tax=Oldenlandia corymbosa var. corymbosa TaxID=529605 RepID=A0AAV1CPY9_OLDCO|nr:OLC1v1033888C3 [Oldenlandia corymbosa var. corymbosa]
MLKFISPTLKLYEDNKFGTEEFSIAQTRHLRSDDVVCRISATNNKLYFFSLQKVCRQGDKMLRISSRRLASHFDALRRGPPPFLNPSSSYATTFTPGTGCSDRESGLNQPSAPPQPLPPPIQVGFTASAGRGVFATRRIGAGELIHTAKPVVCHPSLSFLHSVCYFCLKRLPANNSHSFNDEDLMPFCSDECKIQSKFFQEVEKTADWSAFNDYCLTHGLKYPLLVKRFACLVISGVADAATLDILQPASLSSDMIALVEKEFSLLRSTLQDADIPTEQLAFMTKKWYTSVLARIRINAFRVELACGSYEDLLSSAAASVEAEAAVGNAVYMLPSFYNHDCDPNAHILWLHNADAQVKALRDIEADEELRICYIDARPASRKENRRKTLHDRRSMGSRKVGEHHPFCALLVMDALSSSLSSSVFNITSNNEVRRRRRSEIAGSTTSNTSSNNVVRLSGNGNNNFLFRVKKNIRVCCQSGGGGGAGKAIKSSGSSSVVTERSSLINADDHHHQSAAGLMEATNLILSPNGGGGGVNSQAELEVNGTLTSLMETPEHGIGIARFLGGKTFFVTGATGFLGKVLIEKILRSAPDVSKIFILIKAKNKEVAMDRLKNEIIDAELFKCLKQTYGKSYQAFMLSKMVPVVGNICESNLGLDQDTTTMITKEVDVIVNSAANTTFDERYDVALDINTGGPSRLITFAKQCHKVKLFLHISTAYVNGRRQGTVMEKPFCNGDSIAREKSLMYGADHIILPDLNVEEELKLVKESKQVLKDDDVLVQEMKNLGLKRANKFGWQDTYVFTKAMGEMMIDSLRGDVPVVIIRPSVIESTYREPFPGWMEGNRMMDPVVLYYGKGQLSAFLVDPDGVLDVVPADMVVNATLAAMAKHGEAGKSESNIYQIASSVVNPLVFKDLATLLYEHFGSCPCIDSNGAPIHVPRMELFNSMDDFSSHVWREAMHRSGLAGMTHPNGKIPEKLENICRKSVEQAKYLANLYEPYTFYGGRFDNSNTRMLMGCLSEEERRQFGFEVEKIDWKDYISNIHIPGLRRHVMKGRMGCS